MNTTLYSLLVKGPTNLVNYLSSSIDIFSGVALEKIFFNQSHTGAPFSFNFFDTETPLKTMFLIVFSTTVLMVALFFGVMFIGRNFYGNSNKPSPTKQLGKLVVSIATVFFIPLLFVISLITLSGVSSTLTYREDTQTQLSQSQLIKNIVVRIQSASGTQEYAEEFFHDNWIDEDWKKHHRLYRHYVNMMRIPTDYEYLETISFFDEFFKKYWTNIGIPQKGSYARRGTFWEYPIVITELKKLLKGEDINYEVVSNFSNKLLNDYRNYEEFKRHHARFINVVEYMYTEENIAEHHFVFSPFSKNQVKEKYSHYMTQSSLLDTTEYESSGNIWWSKNPSIRDYYETVETLLFGTDDVGTESLLVFAKLFDDIEKSEIAVLLDKAATNNNPMRQFGFVPEEGEDISNYITSFLLSLVSIAILGMINIFLIFRILALAYYFVTSPTMIIKNTLDDGYSLRSWIHNIKNIMISIFAMLVMVQVSSELISLFTDSIFDTDSTLNTYIKVFMNIGIKFTSFILVSRIVRKKYGYSLSWNNKGAKN